jgi:uncharacterized membrane protein
VSTRQLVGWPALTLAIVVAVYVFACELLHAAGVRWRSGWPEVAAVVACGVVLAVVFARFFVLT